MVFPAWCTSLLYILALVTSTLSLEVRGIWNAYPNPGGDATIDLTNVLGCHYAVGLDNQTHYYYSDDGVLTTVLDESQAYDNLTAQVALHCVKLLGNNLTISVASAFSDTYTVVSDFTLEDFIEHNVELPTVERYIPMDPDRLALLMNLKNSTSLVKRRKYVYQYEVFASQYKDCSNDEYFFTSTDICQDDQMNPFYSAYFSNPDSDELHINSWPHHRCPSYDYNYFDLPGYTQTKCIVRTLYSWYGSYNGDSCYGHESAPNCTQQEVDEWTGNIMPGVINIGGSYKGRGFGFFSNDF